MRRLVVLPYLAALLILTPSARSDVLELSNGGKLRGTLRELVFAVHGNQTGYRPQDIISASVSEPAKDVLRLKDGKTVEGDLVSVKFTSAGGLLTLERNKITRLEVTANALADARKELLKRQAEADTNDAKSLYELAAWCQTRELKVEAAELAKAVLKADEKGEYAAKAHKLLGHVRYQGEWVSPAEMMRRKKAANKGTSSQAIKEVLAKNEDLYKAYCDRDEEKKREQSARVKEKFRGQWNDATNRIKPLMEAMKKRQKERKAEMDSYRRELRQKKTSEHLIERRVKERFDNDGYEGDMSRMKGRLLKAGRDRARLSSLIKSYEAKIKEMADKRRQRLRVAYQKNKRILLSGKLLTLNQMTDNYDAMCEEK